MAIAIFVVTGHYGLSRQFLQMIYSYQGTNNDYLM